MPRKVLGAICADDLVLWCSEERFSTANYRLQQELNNLEGWTKQWPVRINPRKATCNIFSLSTKEQKANLRIKGQTLLSEDNPTYLGVTTGKRMTLKQQTEKTWSHSQCSTCPHKDVGRYDMGCIYCDSQETVYW